MPAASISIESALQLPAVLTVEEAARLLGLSRTSAFECARRGDLPTLRYGRSLRVPTAKLLEQLGLRHNGAEDAPQKTEPLADQGEGLNNSLEKSHDHRSSR